MPDETLIPVPGAAADPAPAPSADPAPAPSADPAPVADPASTTATPDVLDRIAALEARAAALESENAAATVHAGDNATLGSTVAKLWACIYGASD